MNYSKINPIDVANGLGVRVSLFVSGCNHHCYNCFNKETWDFKHGKEFTDDTMNELLRHLDHEYVTGLTILGGEPMESTNQGTVKEIIKAVRSEYGINKDIWIYTGCTWEELMNPDDPYHTESTLEILKLTDVVVDGRYDDKLRDPSLAFKGSTNQRLINSKLSVMQGRISLHYLN